MWESNLKGPELLLAIAIADHADTEGRCFPGIDTLSQKVKIKKRQIQELIRRLEAKGVLHIETGVGRGHLTVFQFQKVQDSAPFIYAEKVQENAPFIEIKRCSSVQLKDAGSCIEKVQDPASPLKEEPLSNTDINRKERSRPRNAAADPRAKHPAIVAVREVTSLYPDRVLWDGIIELLGDTPDVAKLLKTFTAWRGRGYNALNYEGILAWYQHGIPPAPGAANGNGNHSLPSDPCRSVRGDTGPAGPAYELKPLRPSRAKSKEEIRAWAAILECVRRELPDQVFKIWFPEIVFDGIAITGELKLRGYRTTCEWVRSYYSELIERAAAELGLGQTGIEWEIEEEIFETVEK